MLILGEQKNKSQCTAVADVNGSVSVSNTCGGVVVVMVVSVIVIVAAFAKMSEYMNILLQLYVST